MFKNSLSLVVMRLYTRHGLGPHFLGLESSLRGCSYSRRATLKGPNISPSPYREAVEKKIQLGIAAECLRDLCNNLAWKTQLRALCR
jgi:hypothetical protein